MSDQYSQQRQRQGDYEQYDKRRERDEQQRQQMFDRRDQQRQRNNEVQGASGDVIPRQAMEDWTRGEYEKVEQPGLHPANKPGQDSYDHKTVHDLEDITGNPGHRGANPNVPATSINPAPQSSPVDEPFSINEPPGSEVLPPEATENQDDDQGQQQRVLEYNPSER